MDEVELCARLQWLVNCVLIRDWSPPVTGGAQTPWGVQHVASHRAGPVLWAVFDSHATRRRYIVFRGYAPATLLPLPLPLPFLTSRTWRPSLVNGTSLLTWRLALGRIRGCFETAYAVVLSGYSVGASYAVLTALDARACARVLLYSPFPFCSPGLFDAIPCDYRQVWIDGDHLTRLYSPLFRVAPSHQMRLLEREPSAAGSSAAAPLFWRPFAWARGAADRLLRRHSSKAIAIAVAGKDIEPELARILVRFGVRDAIHTPVGGTSADTP